MVDNSVADRHTAEASHEGPYRVTDFHGNVVSDELDTAPPELTQEEIDLLVSHVVETRIFDTAVADALLKLPDSEGGRGDVALGIEFGCQKCKDEIEPSEDTMVTAFGHFYHKRCVDDE